MQLTGLAFKGKASSCEPGETMDVRHSSAWQVIAPRLMGGSVRQIRPLLSFLHSHTIDLAEFFQTCPEDAWIPPRPRREPHAAVLTDFLKQVPEFERALLPRSRGVVTRLNRAVRALPRVAPCETTQRNKMYGRVGLAIDRAALLFAGQDILERPRQFLTQKRLLGLLEVHAATVPKQPHQVSRATIGWLLVIAGLEPVIRGFRPLSDIDTSKMPRSRRTAASARNWLESVVPEDLADELTFLLQSLTAIMPQGTITANPAFGCWGSITGSDGDLIVDDTLIEIKCTLHGIGRSHVAQIISYAALNALRRQEGGQHFEFSKLALCLPRHTCLLTGTIDDWLGAFGAPTLRAVVEGLARFATSFGEFTQEETASFRPLPWAVRFSRGRN